MQTFIPTSIIYRATCLTTGLCYIGYTSKGLKSRKWSHHNNAFKRLNTGKFYNAMRKYGADNFVWDILYESWDIDYCYGIVEAALISQFNTMNNGYNTSPGGFRGPILCGEANGMFGKTHTQKVKDEQGARSKILLTGKTYEEILGDPIRAAKLRQSRSVATAAYMNSKDNTGRNNTNYKSEILDLFNVVTKERIQNDRVFITSNTNLSNTNITELLREDQQIAKGWILTKNNTKTFHHKLSIHSRSYCKLLNIPYRPGLYNARIA